jgi:hypothetical protein
VRKKAEQSNGDHQQQGKEVSRHQIRHNRVIPLLLQNPKVLVGYDAEVV